MGWRLLINQKKKRHFVGLVLGGNGPTDLTRTAFLILLPVLYYSLEVLLDILTEKRFLSDNMRRVLMSASVGTIPPQAIDVLRRSLSFHNEAECAWSANWTMRGFP